MIVRPLAARTRGFSLVELMVALVVSLLLLAGILQILLSNRASSGAQQTLAGLQENSRLASFVIENIVAHAGYRVNLKPEETFRRFLFPQTSNDGFTLAAGSVVASRVGEKDSNDPVKASDAVRIRFQGGGGVHDCLGSAVGTASKPALGDVALYVKVSNAGSPALYCENYAAGSQPLVDHVERFRVRYGLDTDGNGSVDAYTDSLTPDQQAGVRSLRLQLVLATQDNVLPSASTRTFTFANGDTLKRTDRRARQMVDQTVALRNLLP